MMATWVRVVDMERVSFGCMGVRLSLGGVTPARHRDLSDLRDD